MKALATEEKLLSLLRVYVAIFLHGKDGQKGSYLALLAKSVDRRGVSVRIKGGCPTPEWLDSRHAYQRGFNKADDVAVSPLLALLDPDISYLNLVI